MSDSPARIRLRRALEAHISELGYSSAPLTPMVAPVPELVRVSPVRGRVVYGETVLRGDLGRKRCHERLRFFSQRRTRHRSNILFFIGVAEEDQKALETLLADLDIRSGLRGGHVHIVPIAVPRRERRTARAAAEQRSRRASRATGARPQARSHGTPRQGHR
jgi:hypothetical protein